MSAELLSILVYFLSRPHGVYTAVRIVLQCSCLAHRIDVHVSSVVLAAGVQAAKDVLC